ncbi:MAG: ROK family protein [Calditrichaeota bacterium]|nr:ROK family protein [Calditrichota bacterium]
MPTSEFNVVGLDIGGTRLKAALVSFDGSLTGNFSEASRVRGEYNALLEQILNAIERLQSLSDIPLKAIGLGVAGLLDKDRRNIIASPNCIAFLKGSLVADLEFNTGLPVVMDNDANMFAVGEGFIGAAQGSDNFIAITLGTGVGGAIVSGGRLVRGIDGGGGEIGHIPISIQGPVCGCGSNGCLESYIGRTGLRSYIFKKHPFSAEFGLRKLALMAKENNLHAIDVFRYIGRMLGIGLAGLVNIFNPEIIVIGGGISASGPYLYEAALEEISKRAFKVYQTNLRLKSSALGSMAGVVGAGRCAFEEKGRN